MNNYKQVYKYLIYNYNLKFIKYINVIVIHNY